MGWLGSFLTANMIGIGSNFDNSGVGLAYGSEKVRFPHFINAIVNAVGCLTALLGAFAGRVVSHYLSVNQASYASCVVLIAIGIFFWYAAYLHPRLSGKSGTARMSIQAPDWKQGIVLGLALSFTNVASGFGATVSDAASLWATVASITLWGFAMVWLGNIVGIGFMAKVLGRYASFAAGLLLILVGVHQVI